MQGLWVPDLSTRRQNLLLLPEFGKFRGIWEPHYRREYIGIGLESGGSLAHGGGIYRISHP